MTPNICARDKTPLLPRGQTTSSSHQKSREKIRLNPLHTYMNLCGEIYRLLFWTCINITRDAISNQQFQVKI